MQRITARLLLLFALVGSVLPIALAATVAPPHACCLRMAHKCHGAASSGSDASFSAANCCSQDCSRAVTTSQWANPQPRTTTDFAHEANGRIADSRATVPVANPFTSRSTRAPPAC